MLLAIIALVLVFFKLKKSKRESHKDVHRQGAFKFWDLNTLMNCIDSCFVAPESDLIQHSPSGTSQSYLTREMSLREDGQGHISSSNAERTFLSPPPSANVGSWALPPSKAGLQASLTSASPDVPAGLPPYSA